MTPHKGLFKHLHAGSRGFAAPGKRLVCLVVNKPLGMQKTVLRVIFSAFEVLGFLSYSRSVVFNSESARQISIL